jgi:hypothetical protein
MVKYHEETLVKLELPTPTPPQPQCLRNGEFLNNQFPYWKANVNLVGWSENIGTPESIGAKPCRHCDSGFHWDNECKHSQKGEKVARVNLIQLKDDDLPAQEDYDNLFYDLDSDSEEGSYDKLDFCEPLIPSEGPPQRHSDLLECPRICLPPCR